jgi:hypothetical protein
MPQRKVIPTKRVRFIRVRAEESREVNVRFFFGNDACEGLNFVRTIVVDRLDSSALMVVKTIRFVGMTFLKKACENS